MLLALDLGNTNLVWGVFEEDVGKGIHDPLVVERTSTEILSASTLTQTVEKLLSKAQCTSFSAIMVSSVVPQHNELFTTTLRPFSTQPPFLLMNDDIPISNIYQPPESVGTDRLVSAYAAVQCYSAPMLIVDFGTATTFNVISGAGEYVGGAIAPGLGTGAEALFAKAARLQPLSLALPESSFGNASRESLLSGIVGGHLAMAVGMSQAIVEEYGNISTIVATGGWHHLLRENFPATWKVDPHLTIRGVALAGCHAVRRPSIFPPPAMRYPTDRC